MDIRHLKVFIEVADSGKMSTAASKLFISQPTVSQTIRELEEYYNVLLFERLCKKLHITHEGKLLLSYAKAAVKQFDDLEAKMSTINDIYKIKIGATITVGSCLISDIVNSIKEKNSNIETYVYVNNTKAIEEKLLNSEIDIAIVEGEINNPNLVSLPEIDDYLVLACGLNHKFSSREVVELPELLDLDFVMREKGSGTRKLFEDYMYENGFDVKIKWETNCPEAMKNAILKNGCLGAISIRLIENEIKQNQIRVFKHIEHVWNRSFSLVYHKDKIIDETMDSVIEVIKAYKNVKVKEDYKFGKVVNTCLSFNIDE